MPYGVITKIIEARGFCFIRPDNGDADVFCHCKDLCPSLVWGEHLFQQRVEYETRMTPRGLQAADVRERD